MLVLLMVSTHTYYAPFTFHPSVLTKGQMSPTWNDSTGAFVGVFFGGIAVGAVTVLLVVGIVCGVCKLGRHHQQPTSNKPPSK